RVPSGPPGSVQGVNAYTGWFAGHADMGGDCLRYDGPCPPRNDSLLHHYHVQLYALDVSALALVKRFTRHQLQLAMAGHVLAEAELVGTCSLNPAVAG